MRQPIARTPFRRPLPQIELSRVAHRIDTLLIALMFIAVAVL